MELVISMDEIPDDLVINFDQTGIHYIPVSDWMMAEEGAKRTEIAGKDDKRQITAVFAGSMAMSFTSTIGLRGENDMLPTPL